MNQEHRQSRLLIPLQSKRPTGMGIAAAGAEQFLRELQPGYRAPVINRWFQRLNDSFLPGVVKMLLRLLAVQLAPLFYRGPLIFASHHAPLWRTGRHAIVVHDLISLHHPEQHPNQTRFFRWLMPRVAGSARQVIAISTTMREELLQYIPLAPERITVIPSYSPKIERYRPAAASREERVGRREFLFVGANFLHKNLDTAIAAVMQLAPPAGVAAGADASSGLRPGPVRLVAVGCRREIWEKKGLALAELEAGGVLEIREYVTEEELQNLYATVSALVYIPSTEGMGLPPLEAMAAGCPVVCSDIPVLRETCGEAAFYVDRTSAALAGLLRRILAGELNDEIERRRELGFAQVKRFSADALRAKWKVFLATGGERE
jgi:glycosyltransferase involved in cell wall biosynthesis